MAGLISKETIATWKIWAFGFLKVPMILYCWPRVVTFNGDELEVKIKLRRRTRNHMNSMYFGALTVGADVTCGFLTMKFIEESKRNIVLLFKDTRADFLKRAEGDVHFHCGEGQALRALVQRAIETGKRQNIQVPIVATVPAISPEPVANFFLTLSIKDKSRR